MVDEGFEHLISARKLLKISIDKCRALVLSVEKIGSELDETDKYTVIGSCV